MSPILKCYLPNPKTNLSPISPEGMVKITNKNKNTQILKNCS